MQQARQRMSPLTLSSTPCFSYRHSLDLTTPTLQPLWILGNTILQRNVYPAALLKDRSCRSNSFSDNSTPL